MNGDLILAGDIETLRPLYRGLLDRYREVEGRYEAGETALAPELQQRGRQLGRLLNRVEQLEKLS